MDIGKILAELRSERERIDAAIRALEAVGAGKGRISRQRNGRRRRHLSAEGRRRISEAMKKRWAERKRRSKVA